MTAPHALGPSTATAAPGSRERSDMSTVEPVRAGDTAALEGALRRARGSALHRERLRDARADRWEDTVPFMGKEDLRAAYPFGLLAVDRSQVETFHESSGTTGRPTSSYFTRADWDDVADRCARGAHDLGPADTVLVKTPYAMVTTAHQMHRAAVRRGAMVVPADNRSSVMSYRRVLQLLADLEVTATWSLPTETLLWAAAATLLGGDPRRDFPALRAMIIAGEATTAAKRRRIGELFDAAVYQDFGSTETGSMAGQCREGSMHLWADQLYVEVIDEQGRSRPEGEGSLVITTLTREAMPLVRYRMGDHARASWQPCACGSALPTVEILGRGDGAQAVGGAQIRAVDVEAAVFDLPLELGVLFYRARAARGGLEVQVERGRGTSGEDGRDAAERLRRLLDERLAIPVRVEALDPGALVAEQALLAEIDFRKPRFLFGPEEDWDDAITY